jgi:NAD(P)-dependent dehydrogenase (short-subunit alcohol dehydrogenase family)
MILERHESCSKDEDWMELNSFSAGGCALVQGASRGIGLALVEALLNSPHFDTVIACCRHPQAADGLRGLVEQSPGRLQLMALDVTDPASVQSLAMALKERQLAPSLVVNVAGLLHDGDQLQPEKRLEDIKLASLERVFAVNAFGPALVMKHLLPLMAREGKAVMAFLSARVGSIGDNRLGGWYAYRSSKAAMNQFMKTASVEAQRRFRNVILTALHPGTTDTDLSAPFQANVPAGKLFTPAFVAERLLQVIDELAPADSGSFRAWDGQPIEW